MKFDPKQLMSGIKSYIQRQLEPVSKRIDDIELVQKSMQSVDLEAMVNAEVEKRMADIHQPIDGENGRDALEIEILPEIDTEKTYPRGTYARHSGGLWRSFQQTTGLHGWECIVDGVAETVVGQIDTKSFQIKSVMSSGAEYNSNFTLPVTVYRGTYDADETYTKGDLVTWGGSLWHAEIDDNQTKPGTDDSWKLAVKRGNNGRDLR